MLYYFYGNPKNLYHYGEFMSELRKRSQHHQLAPAIKQYR